MNFDLKVMWATVLAVATSAGLKLFGAIVIWLVGRWLITLAGKLVSRAMIHQKVDATVIHYMLSAVKVVLNIALILAVLGFLGVETTSFAALLAAAGIAIGAAWSGLLANFAAGIFLLILRPFRVGNFVTAGGVTGTVEIISLFGVTFNTPDNILTIVGNAKILGDTIQNFSTNEYRRVDLVAQLDHGADCAKAAQILKAGMARIPNVLASPAPVCEILTFSDYGPILAVRPFCNNEYYWQVYFDTNKLISESLSPAGFTVPERRLAMRSMELPISKP